MLKLCDDLQNIIIAYLDLYDYYMLYMIDDRFSIIRYKKLYTTKSVININSIF